MTDRKRLMDDFGEILISNVRDEALKIAMDIVMKKTKNPVKIEQYKSISELTEEQQEAVCDLLSETVTDVIYRFLEMFEENEDKMEISLIPSRN